MKSARNHYKPFKIIIILLGGPLSSFICLSSVRYGDLVSYMCTVHR